MQQQADEVEDRTQGLQREQHEKDQDDMAALNPHIQLVKEEWDRAQE